METHPSITNAHIKYYCNMKIVFAEDEYPCTLHCWIGLTGTMMSNQLQIDSVHTGRMNSRLYCFIQCVSLRLLGSAALAFSGMALKLSKMGDCRKKV